MSRRGAPGSLKAGEVIGGKYRVERLLGEGGMGMVVAAHHVVLDQPVAVKLLYNDDEEAVARLIMEAKAAARIPGEHVARVLDIDRGEDGLPFIVMELLDGVDLYQVMRAQGALPRWLVVDYMLQALMGLAGAHARGIVHRDLKPSNLFLAQKPDGSSIIKVLDFGVSKSTMSEEEQRLTGAKAMLGSPPYMSPEQVRSPKTVDTRADIWTIGIVMFELLTTRLPFRGQEVQETFAQILESPLPRLRDIAPEVPAGLEDVIKKCLLKNREERFQNVHELAAALVPFGSGTWTHAAEEVRRTLARPLPEDTNPSSRSRPGALVSLREVDVQPTASTVIGKRKFPVGNEGSRSPIFLVLALVSIGVALLAGALMIHKRKVAATALADEAAAAQNAVPPAQAPLAQTLPAQTPLAQTAVPLVQTAEPAITELDQDAGIAVTSAPAPHGPQPSAPGTRGQLKSVPRPPKGKPAAPPPSGGGNWSVLLDPRE